MGLDPELEIKKEVSGAQIFNIFCFLPMHLLPKTLKPGLPTCAPVPQAPAVRTSCHNDLCPEIVSFPSFKLLFFFPSA